MSFGEYWAQNSATIVCAAAGIWAIWHFFVRRWITILLYKMGYMRYSSYEDELRGLNDHVRLLRRNFRRMQRIKRKCYYRLLPNEDGTLVSSVLSGGDLYRLECLETGEVREMERDWLLEALHFKIISNAALVNGEITIVPDVFTGTVPEYNKKVGDVSYFNLVIGAYSDWSAVRMDVDAVTSDFF